MISHTHKFIFIHIPKTGGTSIESVLGDRGISLQGPKNFNSVYHKHIAAPRLRILLGTEYNKYFRFSIVRNPWDWLVSLYEYCRGLTYPFIIDTDWTLDIPDYVKDMPFDDWVVWFARTFDTQQIDLISTAEKGLDINRAFRYEKLGHCLRVINRKLDLELDVKQSLPRLEASDRKALDYYYPSGRVIDLVSKHFSRDVSEFGYSFDDLID